MTTARRHGCWMAAAAACGIAAAAQAGQIRLWPTAIAPSSVVSLADVAAVSGFDAATVETLSAVEVSAAPHAGGQILIRFEDVRGALAEAGVNLADVHFLGASRCLVSRPAEPPAEPTLPPRLGAPKRNPPRSPSPAMEQNPTQVQPVVTEGTLEAALRQFILARSPDPAARMEIRFSPAGADDLKLTSPPYEFHIRPRDDRRIGLLAFEVGVSRDGEPDAILPVVAEAALLKEVVVARRTINRGETVTGRALRLEVRRFTRTSDIGLTDLAAAIGQQSRALVREGDMLTASALETTPLVTRGQAVTIWIRQGALVIRAAGRAQREGRLGDAIPVVRDGSRRKQDVFEAVVTGPGTVTLGDRRQLALR